MMDEKNAPEFDPLADVGEVSAADGISTLAEEATAEGTEIAPERRAESAEMSMKTEIFGDRDVRDFTDFSASDTGEAAGEYLFAVERNQLFPAVSVAKQTSMGSRTITTGLVKITLFEDRIRLATFNQYSFTEYLIPTLNKVGGVEDGGEIALVFDIGILEKISRSFPAGVINFRFKASERIIQVESERTFLEISTYPVTEFTDYHRNLEEPEYVGPLHPILLSEAVEYHQLFIDRRDQSMPRYNVSTFRDSGSVSGHASAVGHYRHEAFEGLDLSVRNDTLKTLSYVLGRLNPSNTHLFRTRHFNLIRDENVYLGLERAAVTFPDTSQLLDTAISDRVSVGREQMQRALTKLSIVNVSSDLLVRLQISGQGLDAKMRLETKDISGKVSHDTLPCLREEREGEEPGEIDVSVKIATLRLILSHFTTANTILEIPERRKGLHIVDEPAEGTTCVSICLVLSEGQISQMREARERAKSKDSA